MAYTLRNGINSFQVVFKDFLFVYYKGNTNVKKVNIYYINNARISPNPAFKSLIMFEAKAATS